MGSRAHYVDYHIAPGGDGDLEPKAGAAVYIYNQGTTTPISATIYRYDSDGLVPSESLSNPIQTGTDGKYEFYLAAAARVDLKIVTPGGLLQDVTRTVDVSKNPSAVITVEDEGTPLTQRETINFAGAGVAATDAGGKTVVTIAGFTGNAGHTLKESGTSKTQRTGMNFDGSDFDLADDAGNNETDIALSSTVPKTDEANVFTQNQKITKDNPQLILDSLSGGRNGYLAYTEDGGSVTTYIAYFGGETKWSFVIANNDLLKVGLGGVEIKQPEGLFYAAGTNDLDGSGSPEGVVTAPIGSTYRRTNGGASTTFYVKESGSGNTGWVAHGAASVSVAEGSYTGNGSNPRTITLAFTPKYVVVADQSTDKYFFSNVNTGTRGVRVDSSSVSAAMTTNPNRPLLTTSGFIVGSTGGFNETNSSGDTFHYFAIG